MMEMSVGVEDWELSCSWPPVGDQWQFSVDQFFEPYELLGNKSGEAERQLFGDDVIAQNHGFNSPWSDGGSCMCFVHSLLKIWEHCACFSCSW